MVERDPEIEVSWGFDLKRFDERQSLVKYLPDGSPLSYYFEGDFNRTLSLEEAEAQITPRFCGNQHSLQNFFYDSDFGCHFLEGYILSERGAVAQVSVVTLFDRGRKFSRIYLCFSDSNIGRAFFQRRDYQKI